MKTALLFIATNIALLVILAILGVFAGMLVKFWYEDLTLWQAFTYGLGIIIVLNWFHSTQQAIIKWSVKNG